jgi:hypothetical protein
MKVGAILQFRKPEKMEVFLNFGSIIILTKWKRTTLIAVTEPEFLNFYGAQETIPRNQFRLSR